MNRIVNMLLVVICLLSSSCVKEEQVNPKEASTEASTVSRIEGDTSTEREFGKITAINAEYLIFENLGGEIYHIDLAYNSNFSKGDSVLLLYKNRVYTEEGFFEADVYALYANDNHIYPRD